MARPPACNICIVIEVPERSPPGQSRDRAFDKHRPRRGGLRANRILLHGPVGRPVLLSLSRTIEANRKEYYNALQMAQTSNEVTAWIHYFVNAVLDAQIQAESEIEFVVRKAHVFN